MKRTHSKTWYVVVMFICFEVFIGTKYLNATPVEIRWTGDDDPNSSLTHIIEALKTKSGLDLNQESFTLLENRDLAHFHFQTWVQVFHNTPIHNRSLRVWTDLTTGSVVQVEALLDNAYSEKESAQLVFEEDNRDMSSKSTMALVKKTLAKRTENHEIRSIQWKDIWIEQRLIRLVKVKSKRGIYTIKISLKQRHVIETSYQEFPQADDFSLPAKIYPIYERPENSTEPLEQVSVFLTHLKNRLARVNEDPFASLRNQHYLSSKLDPVQGELASGREQGFWSMNWIKGQALQIRNSLPTSDNNVAEGGMILEGTYATINLHPDAVKKFSGIEFNPKVSNQFFPYWQTLTQNGSENEYEMIPKAGYLGRPIMSQDELLNRPARMDPENNPVTYINDGFDEVQVYYAINTLFETLHNMGFSDPELSTRPFNAFLYDPDIAMRNNAYYTDDTINFTTYSAHNSNMARDNSTIWHELGHGVMDRLMGDVLELHEAEGLAEGMADFVAAILIEAVSHGQPFPGSNDFRIMNHTGFYFTNESHDEGEAYGGTMYDFLMASIRRYGANGLTKVANLTMDAMRLTRNNPNLTAISWFKHMLFADQLARPGVRAAGELSSLLLEALKNRNLSLNGQMPATFVLKFGDQELDSVGIGSRRSPIEIPMRPDEEREFQLTAQVKNSHDYQFKFPLQVRVEFAKGALQGAIHWTGEENGPQIYTVNSEQELAQINLNVIGACDLVNRDDGSCVDYAYVQIWNQGETSKPQAKKRFYLHVKPGL